MKWTYWTMKRSTPIKDEELNVLSNVGWELTGVLTVLSSEPYHYIFRIPKNEKPNESLSVNPD